MGRPGVGRLKSVDVRLTEDEAFALRERAEAAGENVSAYIRRRALLGVTVSDAQRGMGEPAASIIRALTSIGVTLDQIVKLYEIHEGSARTELEACLAEVRAAILRLDA